MATKAEQRQAYNKLITEAAKVSGDTQAALRRFNAALKGLNRDRELIIAGLTKITELEMTEAKTIRVELAVRVLEFLGLDLCSEKTHTNLQDDETEGLGVFDATKLAFRATQTEDMGPKTNPIHKLCPPHLYSMPWLIEPANYTDQAIEDFWCQKREAILRSPHRGAHIMDELDVPAFQLGAEPRRIKDLALKHGVAYPRPFIHIKPQRR